MASATSGSLSGIDSRERKLDCYSGLYTTRAQVLEPGRKTRAQVLEPSAQVLEPADLEELRRIFAYARESGHRVTLRAGGHSFDAQALGDDIVVSMLRFNAIQVLPDQKQMRVGPGATWGAILAKLEPSGLVPGVTVTTKNATAGGTLSGDCLSRFSPAYGKEGNWIKSFDLLTTDGELLRCDAPSEEVPPLEEVPPSDWTREQRAYRGVIGGLGYLGAVVAITYRVLPVGQADGRIGVRTRVRKYDESVRARPRSGAPSRPYEDLAADLVPTAKRTYLEASDPGDRKKLDAISSALQTRADGRQSALFFTSAYTTTRRRRLMQLHRPRLALRLVVEWLMRVRAIWRPLWRFYFRFLFRDGEEYVDNLKGFTFIMDGNVRAKRVARRFGVTLRMVQQTFVVPSDPVTAGGWERGQNDLVKWLDYAHRLMLERELTPTIHDVLFVPKDSPVPFLLSANADLAGFAVSYAFATSSEAEVERVKETFGEMADELWNTYRGRVYLVKNVYAKQSTLEAMYGDNAIEFFQLKRELDPGGVLRNDFLQRTFGDLERRTPPPGHANH